MFTTLEENPSYKVLYNENPEFKKLCDEHMDLKKEAGKLSGSRFLNETESVKLHQLKQRKLEIKDKLQIMLNKYHS